MNDSQKSAGLPPKTPPQDPLEELLKSLRVDEAGQIPQAWLEEFITELLKLEDLRSYLMDEYGPDYGRVLAVTADKVARTLTEVLRAGPRELLVGDEAGFFYVIYATLLVYAKEPADRRSWDDFCSRTELNFGNSQDAAAKEKTRVRFGGKGISFSGSEDRIADQVLVSRKGGRPEVEISVDALSRINEEELLNSPQLSRDLRQFREKSFPETATRLAKVIDAVLHTLDRGLSDPCSSLRSLSERLEEDLADCASTDPRGLLLEIIEVALANDCPVEMRRALIYFGGQILAQAPVEQDGEKPLESPAPSGGARLQVEHNPHLPSPPSLPPGYKALNVIMDIERHAEDGGNLQPFAQDELTLWSSWKLVCNLLDKNPVAIAANVKELIKKRTTPSVADIQALRCLAVLVDAEERQRITALLPVCYVLAS